MSTIHSKGPFPLITKAPLPPLSAYATSVEIDTSLLDFVILDLDYTQSKAPVGVGGLKMKWEFLSGIIWRPASISKLTTFIKTPEGLESDVDVDIRRFPLQDISTDFIIRTQGRARLRVLFADTDPLNPGNLTSTFSCWVGSQLG